MSRLQTHQWPLLFSPSPLWQYVTVFRLINGHCYSHLPLCGNMSLSSDSSMATAILTFPSVAICHRLQTHQWPLLFSPSPLWQYVTVYRIINGHCYSHLPLCGNMLLSTESSMSTAILTFPSVAICYCLQNHQWPLLFSPSTL